VAQVSNCKIITEHTAPLLVADGASSRIDVEMSSICVKQLPQDTRAEQINLQFENVPRQYSSKMSDTLKSFICCDRILFSNSLLQHNVKRRFSAGSIISLCDVSENLGHVFESFTENFPHLPEPAAGNMTIEK
jgi:hypothetical protein